MTGASVFEGTDVVCCSGTDSCTGTRTVPFGEGFFSVTVFVADGSIFATEGAACGAGPLDVELLEAELLGVGALEPVVVDEGLPPLWTLT